MSAKAIEKNHWLPIRHSVTILIGNEIKVGQRHHPHSSKTHFDTAYIFQLIVENDALVMRSIAIGILENDDSVLLARLFVWIIIGFSHPQPSAVINAETDWLLDIRFTSKKGHVESLGHLHGFSRFQWREGVLDDRLRILLGTPKMRSAKNGK